MSLTIGLIGLDAETEAEIRSAFAVANARVGSQWKLTPEAEAENIMVDMDTMYGPMSWLRLHAAGKNVIGLTSAPRTQADFRLGRPFDIDQMTALLEEITKHGQTGAATDGDEALSRTDTASAAKHPAPASESPVQDPAAAVDDAPEETVSDATLASVSDDVHPTDASGMAPAPGPQGELAEESVEVEPDFIEPGPVDDPVPETPPVLARDAVFADWMRPDALPGRVRYRRHQGPVLFIDPAAQTWHGPSTLKTIIPAIEGTVESDAFEPVDDEQWARESVAAGAAQPLSRLSWLGGLVAGQGALLPELDGSATGWSACPTRPRRWPASCIARCSAPGTQVNRGRRACRSSSVTTSVVGANARSSW